LENDVRGTKSILEFPNDVCLTMIGRRNWSALHMSIEAEANEMYPARMTTLVLAHATFLAAFVWLFH